jgi:hypothetical protein
MKAITSEFFALIPRAGFPSSKPQSIGWKELGLPLPTQHKKDTSDDKSVVMVSMRHDYGEAHLSPVSPFTNPRSNPFIGSSGLGGY